MEFKIKILVPSKSATIWSVIFMIADNENELTDYLEGLYEGTDTKYEILPNLPI